MTYLACLAVGFLVGFAFGFKVAAMIKLGVQQLARPIDQVAEESAP